MWQSSSVPVLGLCLSRVLSQRRFGHSIPNAILSGMKAHVWVMPKRTVLDPQGQTIHHALTGLGYEAVKDVRQGKFFVLTSMAGIATKPKSSWNASRRKS